MVVGEAEILVTDAQQLWTRCMPTLRAQLTEAAWRTCFEGIEPVAGEDGALVLVVPSGLAKERIESRHLTMVRDVIGTAVDGELAVRVDVGETPPASPSPSEVLDGPFVELGENGTWEGASPGRTGSPRARTGDEVPLNPRYTFDTFVIGSSNRLSHAAARSVAETPGKSYNPLFVYGNTGLGKTHLLHAIGNYIRENFPTRHVRYVTTETFLNEFVDAIRLNTKMSFKRRYRECDVLLVDDIQFIESKEGLQEELFHTFNAVYDASKQIVITSDRPPRAIATLEERLRSRFLSGLTTDVQPPELETRLAILRTKAEDDGVNVPDEVLEFIAAHVTDNTRELEGALIRVSAFASLSGQRLTRSVAEQVLSDLVRGDQPRRITPKIIMEATAQAFDFSVSDLCSASRRRPLVIARQIGMYLFRELTDYSYPAIAREFGGRDHTTVIYAVEKITGQMRERQPIYDQVTELIHSIKGGG